MTITIDLPPTVSESDARLYLAIKLHEVGQLSAGQAAQAAGYSKRTFLELLGKHGLSTFDHPASELVDDLKNA